MIKLNEDWFEDLPDVLTDIEIAEEPSTPEQGSDTGVANLLHTLLIDEHEAIENYNVAIANMQSYPELVKIMQDIANEEFNHIGMLQKALESVSPNEVKIAEGEIEAEGTLGEVLY